MPEQHNNTTLPQRARRRGQRMTAEEKRIAKETFLKAMENTANVRAACMQAGVDTSTVYRWQEMDDEFCLRFREANKNANWLLFGEAWRRGMVGEERYVTSQGKLVYGPDNKPLTYREKSDRLLELMLKARLPEFRDKASLDVTTTQNVNVKHQLVLDTRRLSGMTDDELAQFKKFAEKLKAEESQG